MAYHDISCGCVLYIYIYKYKNRWHTVDCTCAVGTSWTRSSVECHAEKESKLYLHVCRQPSQQTWFISMLMYMHTASNYPISQVPQTRLEKRSQLSFRYQVFLMASTPSALPSSQYCFPEIMFPES